jgi:hypothetical protein
MFSIFWLPGVSVPLSTVALPRPVHVALSSFLFGGMELLVAGPCSTGVILLGGTWEKKRVS